MTAAPGPQQLIAAFALHAVWQIPALAVTSWVAVRIGRPSVKVAHAAWVITLLLCVCAPVAATWAGYVEARAQGEAGAFLIAYSATDDAYARPMQREAMWLRLLHRHVSAARGITPFAVTPPGWLARYVAAGYGLLLLLACCQLARSVHRSRLLLRSSSTNVPPDIRAAIERRALQMACSPPRAAYTDAVAGPVLVGTVSPTLLLPPWVETMTADELEAVLAHELAHVRRYDPAWHAVCSLLLLSVWFHPVSGWIASRIRQTREMACDAAAAEQLGSASRYAHALLQVAERVVHPRSSLVPVGLGLFDTAAFVRDGRLHTPTQPATAGLELFGAHGAMEERMHTMLTGNGKRTLAGRVARGGAAALIAISGITAAWSLRVQPALAAQQTTAASQSTETPLVSAHNAQQQLRTASRRLRDAAATATTDDDRKKIAAAQQAIRLAQSELTAQSSPEAPSVNVNSNVSLGALNVDLQNLNVRLRPHLAALQKLNSPEFQAQIAKQEADAEAMRLKFDAPEFKAQMEKQRANAEAMRLKFDSPEFKAQIEKQRANAEAMRLKFESPEFKAQIQKQVNDATRAMAETSAQMSLMARNEPFASFPTQSRDDQPVKISSGVMAAANLTKPVPVYPVSAKQAKIQGAVVLHVIVDEHGAVEQVSLVSSPDDALTQSATEAVRQWTYRPFLLHGKPTAVDTTVTVHYTLAQ